MTTRITFAEKVLEINVMLKNYQTQLNVQLNDNRQLTRPNNFPVVGPSA